MSIVVPFTARPRELAHRTTKSQEPSTRLVDAMSHGDGFAGAGRRRRVDYGAWVREECVVTPSKAR